MLARPVGKGYRRWISRRPEGASPAFWPNLRLGMRIVPKRGVCWFIKNWKVKCRHIHKSWLHRAVPDRESVKPVCDEGTNPVWPGAHDDNI